MRLTGTGFATNKHRHSVHCHLQYYFFLLGQLAVIFLIIYNISVYICLLRIFNVNILSALLLYIGSVEVNIVVKHVIQTTHAFS